MALAAWGSFGVLVEAGLSQRLAVMPAILLAAAVYGVLAILFRMVTREELALFPKGEKIAERLHIR